MERWLWKGASSTFRSVQAKDGHTDLLTGDIQVRRSDWLTSHMPLREELLRDRALLELWWLLSNKLRNCQQSFRN